MREIYNALLILIQEVKCGCSCFASPDCFKLKKKSIKLKLLGQNKLKNSRQNELIRNEMSQGTTLN